MKIIRSSQACYGCRACELVCAFHHQGVFAPEGGSIRVSKDHQTGKIRWSLDSTCDSCKREAQPLCVRYCSYGALGRGNS
jgi:Fe-S-cluster-containing hydrogenase component 2